MIGVDLVIHARWVAPVVPKRQVIENGAVAIKDGRIVAIGTAALIDENYHGDGKIRREHHLLCPGLVNAHVHAGQALLRGYADDLTYTTWRRERILPAERAWLEPSFVADGTRLAIAEMLRSGTTCFNDLYYFPEAVAQAVAETGIRARIGMIVAADASAYAADPDEYLSRGLSIRDRHKSQPRVAFAFAPESPVELDDVTLGRIASLSDQLDEPVHAHVHESTAEIQQSQAQAGARPLARLHALGLVKPALIAVHATQLSDADIDTLAAGGAQVVHCPESNLKMACGFCPLTRLVDAGINVAIGTDGAASNNDLDMLGEMRTAALLGKAIAGDAGATDAHHILAMATLNGARALGFADEIGSLETGKVADMICVDLDRPNTTPVYDPVAQFVYSAASSQVSDAWVAGNALLSGGRLVAIDDQKIMRRATKWARRIAGTSKTPSRQEALEPMS